jgi:predicted nucleic acid-binding protein
METVVADTCALVSLAIPKADADYETAVDPAPLQYLLTGPEVLVPLQVERELHEMAGYDDIHAAAATNVLAASDHYTRLDPLDRNDTPDELPDHGLDEGETAGIVLANALDVDVFLTDEFRNLARIHALLETVQVVPTPRLLRDYARAGHLRPEQARILIDTIAPHRSWATNNYVQAVRETL